MGLHKGIYLGEQYPYGGEGACIRVPYSGNGYVL
jgi:hypothetical protein